MFSFRGARTVGGKVCLVTARLLAQAPDQGSGGANTWVFRVTDMASRKQWQLVLPAHDVSIAPHITPQRSGVVVNSLPCSCGVCGMHRRSRPHSSAMTLFVDSLSKTQQQQQQQQLRRREEEEEEEERPKAQLQHSASTMLLLVQLLEGDRRTSACVLVLCKRRCTVTMQRVHDIGARLAAICQLHRGTSELDAGLQGWVWVWVWPLQLSAITNWCCWFVVVFPPTWPTT